MFFHKISYLNQLFLIFITQLIIIKTIIYLFSILISTNFLIRLFLLTEYIFNEQ